MNQPFSGSQQPVTVVLVALFLLACAFVGSQLPAPGISCPRPAYVKQLEVAIFHRDSFLLSALETPARTADRAALPESWKPYAECLVSYAKSLSRSTRFGLNAITAEERRVLPFISHTRVASLTGCLLPSQCDRTMHGDRAVGAKP